MFKKIRTLSRFLPWGICILIALLIVSGLRISSSWDMWFFAVVFVYLSWMGLNDVINGNLISQDDLDKADLEWLNEK